MTVYYTGIVDTSIELATRCGCSINYAACWDVSIYQMTVNYCGVD